MATAERTDLADLLETVTPEQWEAPSLCEGWRVRDVVAHVMSFDGVSPLGMFRRAIRGRIVHINQAGVDELASLTTEQLLHRLQAHLRPQGLATILGAGLPCSTSPSIIGHSSPAGYASPDPGSTAAVGPGGQLVQPRTARVAPRPRSTPDADRPGLDSRLGT